MKRSGVLAFVLGVLSLLLVCWFTFPAAGVAGLRFPSYRRTLAEAHETRVDVDSVLNVVEKSFDIPRDTLEYYRSFLTTNKDRIRLPGDDYTFFDSFFAEAEASSARGGKPVRIVHYGDSQIELDRMSSNLREHMQELFGGSGTGMVPALSGVPSGSILRTASGSLARYTMYGNDSTARASHDRYGVMCQVTELSGRAVIDLHVPRQSSVRKHAETFSSVSLLVGHLSEGFTASLSSDTLRLEDKTPETGDTLEVHLLTWQLPRPLRKVRLTLSGRAELYGIMLDGSGGGVAVDNIPLRGSSGTFFTKIDRALMRRSFELDGTRLVILQFGGNTVPYASTTEKIAAYTRRMGCEIDYFHAVAPKARILFIGPADMSRSLDGSLVTWPCLPQLVDSLRAMSLRKGAAFWDMFSVMGGRGSMIRWVEHDPPYAGADYTHFTARGASIMGETLSRSLSVYYDFYCLRRTLPEEAVADFMNE